MRVSARNVRLGAGFQSVCAKAVPSRWKAILFILVNKGALCARGQASLHGLYNPDRIQQPLRKKPNGTWEAISWEEAEKYFVEELQKIQKSGRGADVVFMTQHLSGAIDELVDRWLAAVRFKKTHSL